MTIPAPRHYNCPAIVSEPPAFRKNADEHCALVYDELRRIAASYMRRERGQTLQATALVNEAYMRLAGAPFTDRDHFIGVAARSMRQVLVDRARARGAHKRWAGLNRVSLTESLVRADSEEAMLPALDEALTRLEASDPELARIKAACDGTVAYVIFNNGPRSFDDAVRFSSLIY